MANYVQKTVQGTVLGINDILPNIDTRAVGSVIISVRSGEANVLWGGVNPTASTGLLLTASDAPFILPDLDARNIRIVRNGASPDAVVDFVFA